MTSRTLPPLLHTSLLGTCVLVLLFANVRNLAPASDPVSWTPQDVVPSLKAPALKIPYSDSRAEWAGIQAPLFSPDRKSHTAGITEEASMEAPAGIKLKLMASVSIAGARKVAILTGDEAQMIWLKPGDTLSGWLLESATDTQAVLEKSGNRETLSLYPTVDE